MEGAMKGGMGGGGGGNGVALQNTFILFSGHGPQGETL